MTWLLMAFRGVWKYVALAAGVLVSIFAYGRVQRSKGRTAERAKQTEVIHEKAKVADKVRRDARSDPSVRERVRKFDRNR